MAFLPAARAAALGATALAGAGLKKALTPPKPPQPPQPPSIGAVLQPSYSLLGPQEGSLGGTFLGNNRAPNIAGGKKKTLGGA